MKRGIQQTSQKFQICPRVLRVLSTKVVSLPQKLLCTKRDRFATIILEAFPNSHPLLGRPARCVRRPLFLRQKAGAPKGAPALFVADDLTAAGEMGSSPPAAAAPFSVDIPIQVGELALRSGHELLELVLKGQVPAGRQGLTMGGPALKRGTGRGPGRGAGGGPRFGGDGDHGAPAAGPS